MYPDASGRSKPSLSIQNPLPMVISIRKYFQQHAIIHSPFLGRPASSEHRENHSGVEIFSTVDSTLATLDMIFEYKTPETTGDVEVTLIARLMCEKTQISEERRIYTDSTACAEILSFDFKCREFRKKSVRLEVTATVKMEFPVAPRTKTRDFGQVQPNLTDVTLVVDEEKYHVSKALLAINSPVFYTMFYGPFRESGQSEIKLGSIDKETLQSFLEIFYQLSNIDIENVERLLVAGRMYAAKIVSDQCEQFLITDDGLPREEKYRLANEYGLEELKAKILMDD